MREHHCPGLDGSNPLYFLASLGILRLLPAGSELAWKYSGRWNPVFRTEVEDLSETLALGLRRGVKSSEAIPNARGRIGKAELDEAEKRTRAGIVDAYGLNAFSELGDIKRSIFRTLLNNNLKIIDILNIENDLNIIKLFSAINAEGVIIDITEEDLEHTGFSFSVNAGGQVFIKDFLNLLLSTEKINIKYMIEGDSRKNTDCTSLNWDPECIAMHAYQWQDPQASIRRTDVAANVLAFWGLSSFPVMPTTKGNQTTGFSKKKKRFRWPVWSYFISMQVIDSMIASLADTSEDARSRGAEVLFESRCFSPTKGRYYFSPAKEL